MGVFLFYHKDDASAWSDYLKKVLEDNTFNYTVHTHDVTTEHTQLKQYVINKRPVCILLSPCLLETVTGSCKEFWDLLKQYHKTIVLLCSVEKKDFDKEFSDFSYIKTWKVRSIGNSKQEVTATMRELFQCKLTKEKSEKKPKSSPRFLLFPSQIHKPNSRVAIIFHDNVKGKVEVTIGDNTIEPIKENPCTFVFMAQDILPGEIKICVLVDNKCCGKQTLRFIPPSLIAFDCLDFVRQTLGVAPGNRESLDDRLAALYEQSLPGDNSFNKIFSNISNMKRVDGRSNLRTPTLLHFAAKNGLDQLCCAVLNTPGSVYVCELENVDGNGPIELAEQAGFTELADYIRIFSDTEAVVHALDALYENNSELQKNAQSRNLPTSTRKEQPVVSPKPPCPLPRKNVKVPGTQEHENIHTDITVQFYVDDPVILLKYNIIIDQRIVLLVQKIKWFLPNNPVFFLAKNVKVPDTTEHENVQTYIKAQSNSRSALKPPCPLPRKGVTVPDFQEPESIQTDLKEFPSRISDSMVDLIELNRSVADGEFTFDEGERLCESWKKRTQFASSVRGNRETIQGIRNQYEQIFKAVNQSESKGLFGKLKSRFSGKVKAVDIQISRPVPVDTVLSSSPNLDRCSSSSSASYSSRDSHSSNYSRDSHLSNFSRDSHLSNYSRDSSLGTSIDERDEDESEDEGDLFSSGSSLKDDRACQETSSSETSKPPPLPPRKRQN